MKLSRWHMITSLRSDIGRILERTLLPGGPASGDRSLLHHLDPGSLGRLRVELRTQLDSLKDALSKELTDSESYLVMFPLVLLCDEMVMCRLPKEQQTLWSLLQTELFQINHGGDVFYDFVDERLNKPDTPAMVFEVLYYCLSAGFVGKFGFDGAKVERYKALLSERIPGAQAQAAAKRRRRERDEPAAKPRSESASDPAPPEPQRRSVLWFYAAVLGGLVLLSGGLLVLSNL